jgi:hypothetical protein
MQGDRTHLDPTWSLRCQGGHSARSHGKRMQGKRPQILRLRAYTASLRMTLLWGERCAMKERLIDARALSTMWAADPSTAASGLAQDDTSVRRAELRGEGAADRFKASEHQFGPRSFDCAPPGFTQDDIG